MTVPIQTAIWHGHERESIKDPKRKTPENFCKDCKAYFEHKERRSA